MDFKKIKLVAGREFTIRVRKKSFILTTIFTPILLAAAMIVPSLVMMADFDKEVNRVMVFDESGIVAQNLENSETIEYLAPSAGMTLDQAKLSIDSLGLYAVMHVSQLDTLNNVTVEAFAQKQINMKVTEAVVDDVGKLIERYKLSQYDIPDFEEILEDLNHKVEFKSFVVSSDGKESSSMLEINMVISFVMAMIIYMFVAMFGNMVMSGVINEKSNKIVEVIVSSVKPFDLMIGKILGVASVALTQFFIWVVLTLLIFMGFQMAVGPQMTQDPAMMEQMTAMSGVDAAQLSSITEASDSQMTHIIEAIKEINFAYIIGCFLIYFILGYLLYASMFAAIGSAVDNEADTQQLVMPITIPLLIGLLLMLQAFQNPDSSLAFWASMIPFTSPMVMLARVPFEGCVAPWELVLSIGLLLVTFLVVVVLSGKIYRVGILMHGTKYSWKDLWKWLRY